MDGVKGFWNTLLFAALVLAAWPIDKARKLWRRLSGK
jgi:hypothetical protein